MKNIEDFEDCYKGLDGQHRITFVFGPKPFTSAQFIPSANRDECYIQARQICSCLPREQSRFSYDHRFSFERIFYKLRCYLCGKRLLDILDNLS